jgi:hypothetical protein
MIKLNELREGNYVRCKIYNGNTDVIIPFTWQEVKYLHLFEPIPLITEIIEKCGFELYDSLVDDYEDDGNDFIHLGYRMFVNNIVYYSISNTTDGRFQLSIHRSENDQFLLSSFNYLHEFQNVFFYLQKEELNYKP